MKSRLTDNMKLDASVFNLSGMNAWVNHNCGWMWYDMKYIYNRLQNDTLQNVFH
jgi:hypothetical protein